MSIFYLCENWDPGRMDESSYFSCTAELRSQPTFQGPVLLLSIIPWNLQVKLRTNNAWEGSMEHFCHLSDEAADTIKKTLRWSVEVCSPSWHVEILTSGAHECVIIWRQDLYWYNTRLQWFLNPIWPLSLWKEGTLDTETQTHRGQGHMKTEAEAGLINLPARSSKERWQGSKTRRGKKKVFPKGTRSCWHLDFRLLASRTVRGYISIVLSWQP